MDRQKLKNLRLKAEATQKQMALALGVPYRSYQDWEGGRRNPSSAAIALLNMALSSKEFFKKLKK